MKTQYLIPNFVVGTFLTLNSTQAAPVIWAEYHLGEPGTVHEEYLMPFDSSGNDRHFPHAVGGTAQMPIGNSSFHPDAEGSTAYLDTTPIAGGWHGVGSTFRDFPNNNFAVGIYVRAPENPAPFTGTGNNNPGVTRDFFVLSANQGGLKFSLEANGWGSSIDNRAWLGAANGIPGSFTPNVWVHLAVIRKEGLSTFYLDGVAQPLTSDATPNHDAPHLAVQGGGVNFFRGHLDELRMVTFDPSDSTESILESVQKPAPPKTALVHVGAGANIYDAALSTDEFSIFRVGGAINDSAVIHKLDGFSVGGGSGSKHLIQIARGGAIGLGTYPLIKYQGTIGDLGYAGLELALPPRVTGVLVNNTENSTIELEITAVESNQIVWTGVAGGTWDEAGNTNWTFSDTSESTRFYAGDHVTFDDLAATSEITIAAPVAPLSMVVNNTEKDYIFSGSPIEGPASFNKQGSGSVTFTGLNHFSGGSIIDDGTVQLGDGESTGSLGTDYIINNGTLIINPSGDLTMPSMIAGQGALEKNGAGVVTLAGDNSFTSEFMIKQGTVKVGHSHSLGTTAAGTTILAGGALDLNGRSIGAEHVTFSGTGPDGQGALVNNGTTNQEAVAHLTLGSDASVGGSGRFDLRGGSTTFDGDFKLTKVGDNQVAMVLTTVSVKDIEITAGLFSFEHGAKLNNSHPGSVIVTGGKLGFGNFGVPIDIRKPIILNGGIIDTTTTGANGSAVVASPIELAAPNSTINVQNEATLEVGGEVSGSGSLVKTGPGTLSLTSAPTYTGSTLVSGGVLALALSGLAEDSTVSLATDSTLHLGFSGTNTVKALSIGGVQQPAGTYDANHESGRLTGQGTLTVTHGPSPSPYKDWATSNGIAGATAAEDSDGDGIPNGIEFVIGGDPSGPNSASQALLPVIHKDETYLNFVFRRTPESASSAPFVEYNSNLGDWTPAVHQTDGVIISSAPSEIPGDTADIVTVKIPLALAVELKLFARLRVNLP
jgi:autotransporter-associated beta strand protein